MELPSIKLTMYKQLLNLNKKEKVAGNRPELVKFVNNIVVPVSKMNGDSLPVSAFKDMADGTFPQGSAAYEKRGIAVDVPEWIPENCIQCNLCSYVCPHAVIRPAVMTEEEKKAYYEENYSRIYHLYINDAYFRAEKVEFS